MPKKQSNMRLSDNSLAQLAALQAKLGMTKTQVLTVALDRMAKAERVHIATRRGTGEGGMDRD